MLKNRSKLGVSLAKDNRNLVLEEHCANPWNGKCNNTNIALYIYYRGEKVPICRPCWNDIAEKDIKWGEGIT